MSDEQDPTPSVQKRKRGRPKGSGKDQPAPTLLNSKRRQYSYSLMERIRERIDPDLLIQHNTLILEGKTPAWEPTNVEPYWRVIPDPSPLTPTPTLADRNAAVKWLTERGYGLPVQSFQVEAEIRARIDQLGSGIPTPELQNFNPQALEYIKKALELASGEVIDAEFTEINDEKPETSELLDANSELETGDSKE